MDFTSFLEKVKEIHCQEKRTFTAEYVEVVVAKENWETMSKVLESFFGIPLKPQGENPSHDADKCAKPYGGVRRDQTLYFQKNETASYAALLWPWGNGNSVTLKIIKS